MTDSPTVELANTSARISKLIEQVCSIAGSRSLISDAREAAASLGIDRAIEAHDDGPVFDWLFEMFAYQGISDGVAASFARSRPHVGHRTINLGLERATCPKLRSHWTFEGCGYRKGQWQCGEPDHRQGCCLAAHDLRNGRLNQIGYSLRLFMRDCCDGDFVAWIDLQLEAEAGAPEADRPARLGQALLAPMRNVFGVADKVLSMALSALMLTAGPERPLWLEAGGGMIAIDTLVHNWLHRTGVIAFGGQQHSYGPACYAEGGCEAVVRYLTRCVDARAWNAEYPRYFPRMVQHAIWRFCAVGEMSVCNGVRIDDRRACVTPCLITYCRRVALKFRGTVA